MKKIAAVILCAGSGKRLSPYTIKKPKCLIEIHGIPIIKYQLDVLESHGVKDIVLIVGFKAEMIKKFVLKNYSHLTFFFVHNNNYKTTNTFYSLSLAKDFFLEYKKFFIINGDVIFSDNALKLAKESSALVRFGLTDTEDMKVIVKNNRIEKISKKISVSIASGEAVGIYIISSPFGKSLYKRIKTPSTKASKEFYEVAFEKIISEKIPFYSYPLDKEFAFEIDTPSDLLNAEKLLKREFRNKKI